MTRTEISKELLDRLGVDEWWKDETRKVLVKAVKDLANNGLVTWEMAIDVVAEVAIAIKSEYGD